MDTVAPNPIATSCVFPTPTLGIPSTAVEIVRTLARATHEPLTSFSTLIFKLPGDGLLGVPTFTPLVDALHRRATEAENPERDQQILWNLINLTPD